MSVFVARAGLDEECEVATRRVPVSMLLVIAACSMVSPMAMNMHVPALPGIAESLQISRPAASLTVTVFLWVYGSSMLVLGWPIDKFGRRRTLIAGLGIFGLGALLVAVSDKGLADRWFALTGQTLTLAGAFRLILVARAIEAVGAAAAVVVPRTMVNDRAQGSEALRLLGLLGTFMAIAPALSPLLGELLATTMGWRSIFAMQAITATVLVALAYFLVPETRPAENAGAKGIADGLVFRRSREAVGPVLVMSLMTGAYFAYLAAGADAMLMHFSAGSGALAVLLASLAAVYFLGNLTVMRLAGRYSSLQMLRVGALFTLISAPGIMMGPSYFTVGLAMCVYAYGNGLVMPNALAFAGSVEPAQRARVMSVASAAPFLLGGTLALVATALQLTTWSSFRFLLLACIALSVAISWLAPAHHERGASTTPLRERGGE